MHETQNKSLESLLNLPEGSGVFLEGALLSHSCNACPSMDTLMDFADGSLRKEERQRVQAHLRDCPDCALVMADLYESMAPIRDLHTRWFGWKGPWLASKQKVQDEITSNAWEQHCLHCDRCKQRQASLARPAMALHFASAGGGAFAGILLMLVLLPLFRTTKPTAEQPMQTLPGKREIDTRQHAHAHDIPEPSPVTDPVNTPVNPLDFMQSFLYLEPVGANIDPHHREQVKHDVETWNALSDHYGYKDSIVVHGGLQRIYAWLERTETVPAEKKRYADLDRREKLRLQELVSSLRQEPESKHP